VHWKRKTAIASAWATTILAVLTAIYVILTFHLVSEMREQTRIIARSYQELLRPFLKIRLDPPEFFREPHDRYPLKTMTVCIWVKNDGNTQARIVLGGLYPWSLDKRDLDVRDSLLSVDSKFGKFSDDTSRFSRYVPPRDSVSIIGVYENTPSFSRSDGVFFIHALMLYRDTFESYHDAYYVFKIKTDWKTGAHAWYRAMCDFHDYDPIEIENISAKLGFKIDELR